MDNRRNLVAGDHEMMSEMLNTFFASVFTEARKIKIFFQRLLRCFAGKIVKNYAHFSLLLIS